MWARVLIRLLIFTKKMGEKKKHAASGRHPLQAGELSVLGERYDILSEIVEAGVQLLQLLHPVVFLARRSERSWMFITRGAW
jgi:hypothetical protein